MKSHYTAKYSCLSPEDVNTSSYYAFTLSPSSQPQQTNLGKMRLNCMSHWCKDEIIRSLNRLRYCKYTLFTEISKGGRLHYHGTIMIENIPWFYYHDIPLLKGIGTYEIDTVEDVKIWKQYCLKQRTFMESFCKDNDMTYCINTNGTID